MRADSPAAPPPSGEAVCLYNLTPHPVRLALGDGRIVRWPAAARPARLICAAHGTSRLLLADGTPVDVLEERVGDRVVFLPPPREAVVYIVSRAVARAALERDDLVVPATGPGEGAIRADDGRVVAVRRLKRLLPSHA